MKLKYNELIFDMNGDVNLDNYYTKSECDNKYALKSHTHSNYATTSAVTNAQNTANNALNVANSKSTLDINKSKKIVGVGEYIRSYTPTSNAYMQLLSGSGTTSQRGIDLGSDTSTCLVAANYPITGETFLRFTLLNF